jgi:hypothetical protein
MEYWSTGVLHFGPLLQDNFTTPNSPLRITPTLHYSITPFPYLHGLGSNGFTPTSNSAGPGCANARFKAGCKSRGCWTRSPYAPSARATAA